MKNDRLKTIQNFARLHDQTVASICLPTEVSGAETLKSPIRFKNLIRHAKDQLDKEPHTEALLKQIEQTCGELVNEHEFWQRQAPGLAVFCEPEGCHFVHLPFKPSQAVYVGKRFHVKPLLRLVNQDQQFYVLALSINNCRLLWGDLEVLQEIEVDDLPASLEDALQFDDPEKSLQFHTGTTSGRGTRAAVFHGHGASKDDPQAQLDRYINKVAGAVSSFLNRGGAGHSPRAPLILASVEEYPPLYKRNNEYSGLLTSDFVRGNPDDLSPEQLHEAARPLVGQIVERRESEHLEQFEGLRAQGKASTDPDEISKAVRRGQVATVFVAEDKALLGSVDPVTGKVELFSEDGSESDVLNDIAAEALLQGGDPFVMSAERIPGDSGVAAIYRY